MSARTGGARALGVLAIVALATSIACMVADRWLVQRSVPRLLWLSNLARVRIAQQTASDNLRTLRSRTDPSTEDRFGARWTEPAHRTDWVQDRYQTLAGVESFKEDLEAARTLGVDGTQRIYDLDDDEPVEPDYCTLRGVARRLDELRAALLALDDSNAFANVTASDARALDARIAALDREALDTAVASPLQGIRALELRSKKLGVATGVCLAVFVLSGIGAILLVHLPAHRPRSE